MKKDTAKLKCIFWALVLVASLIPVFMLAPYDAAAGDDYNYGAAAHLAYKATGSVLAAVKAAAGTTLYTYKTWQGTWFDCFVFCLHPEVFSDRGYVLVPFIFVILQIIAYTIFAHHFIKGKWRLGGLYYLEAALIFLTFSFQLVPSQKSAIFWWVGSVHYAMPMCMALIGVVLGDRFLERGKTGDLIGLSVIAALMGGATYPAALLLPIVVFVLWLERAVIRREAARRDALLVIPLILEGIGLYLSFAAPGNAVRSATDIGNGAEPTGGAVATILASITFSVTDAYESFICHKTLVIAGVLIIAISAIPALFELKSRDKAMFRKRFFHPVLFIATAFLINAAMYAPRLYAGGVVSSGYFNFNFWVFFLCITACAIYLMGFVIALLNLEPSGKSGNILGYVIMVGAILVCAYFGRHGIKEYTDYVCLEYYLSGQAADYKDQIELQRRLMEEEGVTDVIVPGINNEQGPLMHMPVVEDPKNIDNYMTALFYGKNSCRSMPRPEWIAQYGEKYGVSQ